jgi:hypothetical protein
MDVKKHKIQSGKKYYTAIQFGITMKLVTPSKMFSNKIYICSKVRKGKNSADEFPIQKGPKQVDALSPLFLNFALKREISKIQENKEGLELNGTYPLLAYADDIIILVENSDIIMHISKGSWSVKPKMIPHKI